MKIYRLISGAAFAAVACAALAGGTTSITASGGSVSAAGPGTGYAGLQGTASTATIQYGSGAGSSSQFKFATGPNGSTSGKPLSGSSSSGGTTTTTQGQSSVTNASGAPTYYTAQWTSTATTSSTSPVVGSGTYDPWTVTKGNLHDAGVYDNAGVESLYYQASLDDGAFVVDPGQEAAYKFVVGEAGITFLDLTVFNDRAPTFTFTTAPDFSVYLLDPDFVYGARSTIQDRIGHGTLLDTQAKGNAEIQDFLDENLQFTVDPTTGNKKYTGSLGGYKLTLAIVYNIQLPAYDPAHRDDIVAQWNTDTVNATPEPATLVTLGLGALAVLRRRRRA